MIVEQLIYVDQFGFQHRFSEGKILNVGCNTDGARLRELKGAVNLDLFTKDPFTGNELPVDVIGDARDLPYEQEFDTVVLGEILEHMTEPDAILAIRQAVKALKPEGRVVITMPHDTRDMKPATDQEYTPGIKAYHHKLFTREDLLTWIDCAGLEVERLANIRYVWGEKGTGVVCRAKGLSN